MTLEIPSNASPSEILQIAHDTTAVPLAIMAFILFNIFFWISAGTVLDWNRVDEKKIFLMWFVLFILFGVSILLLSLSPEMVQSISEFGKSIFS